MNRRGESGACMFGMAMFIALLVTASKITVWAGAAHARGYIRTYALRRAAIAPEHMALEAAEAAAKGFEARYASLEPRVTQLRSVAAGIVAQDRQSWAELTQRATRQYTERWIADQLNAFLISAAAIPGIGTERKRVLASHGIETAADVNAKDVGEVPGFGPKLTDALIDWRTDCARTVAKRTVPSMPAGFLDSLKREHSVALAKSVEKLRVEFSAIRQAVSEREAAARYHAGAVSTARAALRRARARAIEIGPTSS
jgi:DNA-binding helix-hairpin-helix protein with protein kinase domain